jgi:hypothetical protein
LRAVDAGARAGGLDGPYARVGDGVALLLWRRAGRIALTARIAPWPEVVRRGAPLRLEVGPAVPAPAAGSG